MKYRYFYYKYISVFLITTALWTGFHIYLDTFGIFRDVRSRELRINTSERLAKFLFTYQYIPAKFDGVLLGPSLSDVIDTRLIKSANLYNLSLTGGNATELRRLFDNLIRYNKRIKFIVLCVDPYITQKTGMEQIDMDWKLLWYALGSTEAVFLGKNSRHDPTNLSINSEWGRYHVVIPRPVPVADVINSYIETNKNSANVDYYINPDAFADLKAIVSLAQKNNIQVFAYYHPYPEKIYSLLNRKMQRYKTRANKIFDKNVFIWDFNDSRYKMFRNDFSNYLDAGHLSEKGAMYIASEIDKILQTNLFFKTNSR